MRLKTSQPLIALTFVALSLAACASREEVPMSAGLTEDDDTFCRAGGKVVVGSPDYVNCRKDRDVQRNAATSRADHSQRNLAEYMMNHPN